ncbi:hypothetical protein QBC47DRAFT_389998 [Echria macrotheca]|uniref:Uncharacterized protein n=1 Tax=Echria macrotheca TaxID=438768 RepID=A0AAJ0F3G1_9PEZI|nr:hypothetical protein QBC47DRAFT_389998 [Echria macrotheca]
MRKILSLWDTHPDDWTLRNRQLFTMLDLSVFADLEELSLLKLNSDSHNDLPDLSSRVAKVLKSAPNLKSLALSFSYMTVDHQRPCVDWMERVSRAYMEEGGTPLQVRSLSCGKGFFPLDSAHLKALIDVSYLEDVYIENEWYPYPQPIFFYDVINAPPNPPYTEPIDFESVINAPNLRSLKVKVYETDLHRVICEMEDPSRASQIAISALEQGRWTDSAFLLYPSAKYPALPLRPRMLVIDMEFAHHQLNNPYRPTCPLLLDGRRRLDTAQFLDYLVDGDQGVLEGLVLYFPNAKSRSHKLSFYSYGYGEHYTQVETWKKDFEQLKRTLPRLTNLSQLNIRTHIVDGLMYTLTDDVSKLASAIPSLRYINVNSQRFSRIVRDGRGGVELVELQGRAENEEVELYRLHTRDARWLFPYR